MGMAALDVVNLMHHEVKDMALNRSLKKGKEESDSGCETRSEESGDDDGNRRKDGEKSSER